MSGLKEWQVKRENGIYDKRNQINNLTGKEWLFSTRSVKTKNYSYNFDIIDILNANYIDFMPIELLSELILTFTKLNVTIIDPVSNFGSIGYAVNSFKEKFHYYGYNYIKTDAISVDSDKNFIHFNRTSFSNSTNINNFQNEIVLFSELIFTSLDVNSRELNYQAFEKEIQMVLNSLLKSNLDLKFIILCLQNTKGPSSYNYHSKSIKTLLETFNFNLKSELIWKIFDKDFNLIKNHLIKKFKLQIDSQLLLNDKRILIFKMD